MRHASVDGPIHPVPVGRFDQCAFATLVLNGVPNGDASARRIPVRVLEREGDRILIDQPVEHAEPVPLAPGQPVLVFLGDGPGRVAWRATVEGRVGFKPAHLSGLWLRVAPTTSGRAAG